MRKLTPIIPLDYPDPDVIRVGNTYYMISTTMHFMPGGEILRSKDLLTWEHAAFVFDTLDHTPAQTLEGDENAYGKGMWAACLRYRNDCFYVCFVANDTGKTYLYTSKDIIGTWEKSTIEGFYHDASLLFDEDRVFILYGNRSIYLTELDKELHAPLPGGLHRLLCSDDNNPNLGYEGSHFYKIKNKYYLFLIHSLPDRWRRVQACLVSDSLTGEFLGGDVFNEDFGHRGQGVAQGGIVDTPEGDWYSIMFQDRGAVGRLPVLVPIRFEGDCVIYDADEKLPTAPSVKLSNFLVSSDDFKRPDAADIEQYGCFGFRSCWQFNHEPDLSLIHHDYTAGVFTIQTGKICDNLTQARNTLTQRMMEPACAGEVWVDASMLRVGDFAGICALQGLYGMVAVTRKEDGFYLVMRSKTAQNEKECESIRIDNPIEHLRLEVNFQNEDTAMFYYEKSGSWQQIGEKHALFFRLDHFTGCRFGLFAYATKEIGGKASFREFVYRSILMAERDSVYACDGVAETLPKLTKILPCEFTADDYSFTLASQEDIPAIVSIYRSLVGTPGCTWDYEYPSQETAETDIARQELYVLKKAGNIVAVASAGAFDELADLSWKSQNPCELARIGVPLHLQNQGIGTEILRRVMEAVKAKGFDGIRMLVAKTNFSALALYEKNGFQKCEEVFRFNHDYYCYEIGFN